MAKLNAREILGRVAEVIGSDKNKDIADAVGIEDQVCSNWKSRNTIKFDKLYIFCDRHNLSFDWLLTGDECGGANLKLKDCNEALYQARKEIEGLRLQIEDVRKSRDLAIELVSELREKISAIESA